MSNAHARDRLHLFCGEDYREEAINVDANPDVDPDLVLDLTDYPWTPFEDDSVTYIEARHGLEHLADPTAFFEECARVLRSGGTLEITVPLGVNARMDNDHETKWTYETPEQYSAPDRRPWDPEVPFELVDRNVRTWLGGPLAPLTPLFQAAARRWPAWAAARCYGGELTAVYRRVEQ
ncbi:MULTISPECIES: class I SAM-dependent methyltransferase [Halobacteriales]|uniref:Methyltransferase domain-containing protein n=2 Tax=Halobacteriales TaxID=2235 RepID=A0A1I0QZ64_9EURY|nr:methyltransferase domain-containing protein [Natrinema salifodinae]SEW32891.1 Methyltransferase domain-containing protein [Natrinema salifodinae]